MKAPKSSNNNIFLKARDLGPTSLQSYFTLAWPTVCCTCRSSFCCCCCCCRCSGGYKNNWITEHLPLHTWPSLATFDGCCCNQPTRQPNQLTKKTKTNCDVAVVIVCILAFVASFFLFFLLWFGLSPLATFNFIHCRQRQTAAAKKSKNRQKGGTNFWFITTTINFPLTWAEGINLFLGNNVFKVVVLSNLV